MAAAQRKTPGVYVTEVSAFPPSVVGVDTAVPAFIGYTSKAKVDGKSVVNTPVAITSFADYQQYFGPDPNADGTYPPDPPLSFGLTEVTDATKPYDITIGGKNYELAQSSPKFYLSNSIQLFYANGGGNCYVVSVGTPGYGGAVSVKDLQAGLAAIHDQVGPTMLVIPDALLLPATTPADAEHPGGSNDFNSLAQAMLGQCGELGDRVAILDVYGADTLVPGDAPTMQQLIANFRFGVGTSNLSYGMSYFPCLNSAIYDVTDFSYTNFDAKALPLVEAELTAEAAALGDATKDPAKTALASIKSMTTPPATPAAAKSLNQDLSAAFPILKQAYGIMAKKVNLLPASGAMAGVYTHIDSTRGVWNAPANISLNSVGGPTYKVTSATQEDLNLPIQGKAVNAIRDFVGQGTLVWGARTLDGNSNDYRYIQVRRTLVYVEQSIKAALNPFVFAPNDGQTWVTVVAMVSNFLTGLWTQGGLMGAKASDAFSVQCGLGSTMTGLDILNGYMRVQVTLQMIHPAEFIELTFTQKMQGVG